LFERYWDSIHTFELLLDLMCLSRERLPEVLTTFLSPVSTTPALNIPMVSLTLVIN